jgi:hypothetical protein
MGPLFVNEIITQGTDFLFAFLIGIGFGFVLESSGFSSSRRLAGVFYGYDTLVLKVFFTAALTSMLGLLFLSLFGWVDLSSVYVNPTFLYSAIFGGVVMGAGFILGGFCPGTSLCGAVIGKIDAMVFIVGLFIGIIIFAEGYPLWEEFYKAMPLGSPKLNEVIGISQGVLALIFVLVALSLFWVGEWVEKKFPAEKY